VFASFLTLALGDAGPAACGKLFDGGGQLLQRRRSSVLVGSYLVWMLEEGVIWVWSSGCCGIENGNIERLSGWAGLVWDSDDYQRPLSGHAS
jgi:hypothetical protein